MLVSEDASVDPEILRDKLLKQVEEFEDAYGKKLNKISEPDKGAKTLWEFVLNDIEKNGYPNLLRNLEYKRHHSKKLSKAAIGAAFKREKLEEEREKSKIRHKQEISKNIAKRVYKEFWQSTFKIHKFTIQ